MILPSIDTNILKPRMGVARPIGTLSTADGRPGLEVLVIDGQVVMHVWRHAPDAAGRVRSEKVYTVELPAARSADLAELFHQASLKAASMDEPRPVETTIINN